MKKYIAEIIGTFTLVLIACGAAAVAGDQIGTLGIALTFGLTLVGIIYAIGSISGAHVNPAVSIAMFCANRLSGKDLAGYVLAQCIGAILAAGLLYFILLGLPGGYNPAVDGLAHNGWGPGYGAGYAMPSALAFEFVATAIFLFVILESTKSRANPAVAGLAIGLVLAAIHCFGIRITGTSVNPARSLGPALFVCGDAMKQLWLFIAAPALAGVLVGLTSRLFDEKKD